MHSGMDFRSMNDFTIGIIGGTGGMGKWFAEFFAREGYTIRVSGKSTGMSIDEMTRSCRVVIISVPIGVTEGVIAKVGPRMPADSLLMDLTSLKEKPVARMLETSVSEVLGCHPLFGPDVSTLSGQNIILCPARIGTWSEWPGDLFLRRGARVTKTTPETHDEMMSVIQVLNHLHTIIMGMALTDTGIEPAELERFSTPVLKTKIALIEKVRNNPGLYADIIVNNPRTHHIFDIYERNFDTLKAAVEKKTPHDAAASIETLIQSIGLLK
jgi:prephenate dehydrogenase